MSRKELKSDGRLLLSFRVSPATADRIYAVLKRTRRSLSVELLIAVEQYLNRIEPIIQREQLQGRAPVEPVL